MGFNIFGVTDIGLKREANEDSFAVVNVKNSTLCLAVVCDGMGGAKGGKTASSLCTESFCRVVDEKINQTEKEGYLELMTQALDVANLEIFKLSQSQKELSGMGTTLVACLADDEKYYCISLGDSRIYAFTDNELLRVSHDHSFVQTLIDSGQITEEQAKTHPNRNIITKAVGISNDILPDVMCFDRKNVRGILLCSDGLCGYVDEKTIFEVCKNEKDVNVCAEKLVSFANANGGIDNITVVVQKNN